MIHRRHLPKTTLSGLTKKRTIFFRYVILLGEGPSHVHEPPSPTALCVVWGNGHGVYPPGWLSWGMGWSRVTPLIQLCPPLLPQSTHDPSMFFELFSPSSCRRNFPGCGCRDLIGNSLECLPTTVLWVPPWWSLGLLCAECKMGTERFLVHLRFRWTSRRWQTPCQVGSLPLTRCRARSNPHLCNEDGLIFVNPSEQNKISCSSRMTFGARRKTRTHSIHLTCAGLHRLAQMCNRLVLARIVSRFFAFPWIFHGRRNRLHHRRLFIVLPRAISSLPCSPFVYTWQECSFWRWRRRTARWRVRHRMWWGFLRKRMFPKTFGPWNFVELPGRECRSPNIGGIKFCLALRLTTAPPRSCCMVSGAWVWRSGVRMSTPIFSNTQVVCSDLWLSDAAEGQLIVARHSCAQNSAIAAPWGVQSNLIVNMPMLWW